MLKFETPAYVKPSDPTGNTFVFAKSPEQTELDAKGGIARFGGIWRMPSYRIAYMKSARILIDHGRQHQCLDEVALPAFYMQRHSLELFIKGFLSLLYEFEQFNQRASHSGGGTLSKSQLDRLDKSHSLQKLSGDLHRTSRHFRIW